jgi:hypothetical protein
MTSINVAPTIANQETAVQVNPIPPGSIQQQAWARFSAVASVAVVVRANEQIVDG